METFESLIENTKSILSNKYSSISEIKNHLEELLKYYNNANREQFCNKDYLERFLSYLLEIIPNWWDCFDDKEKVNYIFIFFFGEKSLFPISTTLRFIISHLERENNLVKEKKEQVFVQIEEIESQIKLKILIKMIEYYFEEGNNSIEFFLFEIFNYNLQKDRKNLTRDSIDNINWYLSLPTRISNYTYKIKNSLSLS